MTGRQIFSTIIVVALFLSALFTNHFLSERKLKTDEEAVSSLSDPVTIDATSDSGMPQDAGTIQQEKRLQSGETGDASTEDSGVSLASLEEDKPSDSYTKFSDRRPGLFDQRRQNSATFITRDDLPLELQQQFDQVMEGYKRNGYLETDEAYIEHMQAIYNQIVPLDPDELANTYGPEKMDASFEIFCYRHHYS